MGKERRHRRQRSDCFSSEWPRRANSSAHKSSLIRSRALAPSRAGRMMMMTMMMVLTCDLLQTCSSALCHLEEKGLSEAEQRSLGDGRELHRKGCSLRASRSSGGTSEERKEALVSPLSDLSEVLSLPPLLSFSLSPLSFLFVNTRSRKL